MALVGLNGGCVGFGRIARQAQLSLCSELGMTSQSVSGTWASRRVNRFCYRPAVGRIAMCWRFLTALRSGGWHYRPR